MWHLVLGGAGLHPPTVHELRARRKPRSSLRFERWLALRLAERAFLASLIHEPPRTARWAASLFVDAHHVTPL
jgi:hypothetical protein